jgi:UDP-N-acetylmuramoyl-L-alanyl-D-glutamate--2,6-diaminopimelate ligase
MRLSELIGGNTRASAIEILGLTSDSRRVEPGFLFAALPGVQANGANFIAAAIAQGAVAVLADPHAAAGLERSPAYVVADDNPRRRLAQIAARFYGGQPKTAVAVTGTNGKTSIAHFTAQIWAELGFAAGSIGTLGVHGPAGELAGSLTTPEPVALHRSLRDLAASGCDHVAIEASSHGLAQYRLDGVALQAGAFTNLGRDHLDYHASERDYFAAKLRLFTEVLGDNGTAVLNADSPWLASLRVACEIRDLRVLTFGTAQDADVRLANFSADSRGQVFDVVFEGRPERVLLPLFGSFQAANAVCAGLLAHATGTPWPHVVHALGHLRGVPGRLQLAGELSNRARVFIDYAHTPDALSAVLKALRPHAKGGLAVVFGCGGDRDRGKRKEMGRIAAALADRIVVTDDNPRSESPAAIRAEILKGCPQATEIADRREAIEHAVHALAAGEVLVVAGKGHETGQIVGSEVRPFDDSKVVAAALCRSRGGLA